MKTNKILVSAFAFSLAFASFTSCSSDSGSSLPPIGGYDNAGQVGEADLVAYWPLNGNGKESKSNTSPTSTVGATYEDGIKGQGAKLTNGYMKYPSIAALTGPMNAYTISAWAKLTNNQTPTTGSVSVLLSLTRPGEWEGNLNLYAETGQRPAVEASGMVNDSIVFKSGFRTAASDGQAYENLLHLEPWMIADNLVTPNKHVARPIAVARTWAHVVATWDGTTNKFIVYINGVKSSNPAFEVRGSNTSIIFDTPTSPVIGGFGNVDTTSDTWNKPMTGSVDEIRVWKKALSAADVNSLYELELVGR
ncbi:LamG-like jellyroll fold domain-containing protein [Flavobacterium sp.]|uniref:LamG-like jellyroll fold domain-containing protein n=1 Tax=Flavobacterium sp. TaxID=239 RepID=UPI002869FD3E|nr:LamG-like jellyroll fold domain-containing protein [Flavobacterium sp.]